MVEKRLVTLNKTQVPQYLQGAPLILIGCALHYDNEDKQYIAQLKWKNICPNVVDAILISLKCFDAFGHELKTRSYQYDRLSVRCGQSFGEKVPIKLGIEKISKYSVTLNAVAYKDGTVQEVAHRRIYRPLPAAQPQSLAGELLEQYKRDLDNRGIRTIVCNDLQKIAGLWQCVCGSWQVEGDNCLVCGSEYDELETLSAESLLKENLQEYNEDQKRRQLELAQKEAAERLACERAAEERRQKALKESARKKKRNRRIAVVLMCIAIATAVVCCVKLYFIPKYYYDKASSLLIQGKSKEAIEAFVRAGDYSDTVTRIPEAYYKYAESLIAEEKWDEAISAFKTARTYDDAENGIAYCEIRKEEDRLATTMDQDALIDIVERYRSIDSCFDSANRAEQLVVMADSIVVEKYKTVEKMITECKCEEARCILANFGVYGNEKVPMYYYAIAEKYLAEGYWNEASATFKDAGKIYDAEKRVYEPYYHQGMALITDGKWDEAIKAFERSVEYADSKFCIAYCGLRKEEEKLAQTVDQDALIELSAKYADLGQHYDCDERAKQLQVQAEKVVNLRYDEVMALTADGKMSEADSILASFGIYGNQKIPECYYAIGERYLDQSKWDEAITAFEKAGEYCDAGIKILEVYGKKGDELLRAGKEDEAIEMFEKAGAVSRIIDAYYSKAERYAKNGNIQQAWRIYDQNREDERFVQLLYDYPILRKEEIAALSKVGARFKFGKYYWKVMEVNDERIFVISEDIVCKREYHSERKNVSWADSDLRKWLNGEFYTSSFSEEERQAICEVRNKNSGKDPYGFTATKGPTTSDYIFILIYQEIEKYFSKEFSGRVPSGADWWIRTTDGYACNYFYDSSFDYFGHGTSVGNHGIGVRPVMWLELDKLWTEY